MALKSIIRTSASPRQQQSHWGLMVSQDAYFSFLTHAKQLSLIAICDRAVGIGKKSKCEVWTDGRTDRPEAENSHLDAKETCWRTNI